MDAEDPWAEVVEDPQAVWGDVPATLVPPVTTLGVISVPPPPHSPEPVDLAAMVEQPMSVWDPLSTPQSSDTQWTSPSVNATATRAEVVAPIALSPQVPAQRQPMQSLSLQTGNVLSDPLNALALNDSTEDFDKDADLAEQAQKPTTTTTATIDAARYEFEIQVTDPQKIGDTLHLSAHVIYKVKTRVLHLSRCVRLH